MRGVESAVRSFLLSITTFPRASEVRIYSPLKYILLRNLTAPSRASWGPSPLTQRAGIGRQSLNIQESCFTDLRLNLRLTERFLPRQFCGRMHCKHFWLKSLFKTIDHVRLSTVIPQIRITTCCLPSKTAKAGWYTTRYVAKCAIREKRTWTWIILRRGMLYI